MKSGLMSDLRKNPNNTKRPIRINLWNYKSYFDIAEASEGFDVSGCCLPRGIVGEIKEIENANTDEILVSAAKFAVYKHNEDKDANLEFLEIARLNGQMVSGMKYYITLWARDKQNHNKNLYRAIVWWKITDEFELLEFKLAPKTDHNNPALSQKLTAASSKRKRRSGKKAEPLSRQKRPFNVFVQTLRNSPEYATASYNDLMTIAGARWKSMSNELRERMRTPTPA